MRPTFRTILIACTLVSGCLVLFEISLNRDSNPLIAQFSSLHSTFAIGMTLLFLSNFLSVYFKSDLNLKSAKLKLAASFLVFIIATVGCFHGLTWDFSDRATYILNSNIPIKLEGKTLKSQVGTSAYEREILGTTLNPMSSVIPHMEIAFILVAAWLWERWLRKKQ